MFTSTQQVLWKHDGNASSNCSFYGCDPVPAGVSFAFNSTPSANKIYKAFSVETPNLNTLDRSAVNTFVVNDQTNSSGTFKAITVNALKNRGVYCMAVSRVLLRRKPTQEFFLRVLLST